MLNIVLDYEASALAAPQSFRDAVQAAANILDSSIYDNITVTIQVGYNDWDNGVISNLGASAVGGDSSGSYVSYSALRNALASHETSSLDQSFVNSLPTTSSINGVSSLYVPSAIEKALGMISPTASAIDGMIGIGSSVPTTDLVGVALHELTHALGREPTSGTFDLGRYTSPGTHLFSNSSSAPASYFSIDGGVTKLADYGQTSDPSDFLNSGVQGSIDPFNEFYSGSTSQTLSTVDLQQLDALGFDTTTVIGGTGYSGGSTGGGSGGGTAGGGGGGHKGHKTVAAGAPGAVFAFADASGSDGHAVVPELVHNGLLHLHDFHSVFAEASGSADGHAVVPELVHNGLLHLHDFHIV